LVTADLDIAIISKVILWQQLCLLEYNVSEKNIASIVSVESKEAA
jgi:hypothetical protein